MGILREGMDLFNYVIIFLAKSYLWSCRHKDIKPSTAQFRYIKILTWLRGLGE